MSNENESLLNGSLSSEESDAICEMTSIAMGAGAATLGMLLGQNIEISNPAVQGYSSLAELDPPFGSDGKILIKANYVKGISAHTAIIMKSSDAGKLANLMLGSTDAVGDELNEIQMSAVCELMHQILNAAAASMASILHETVEISAPEVLVYTSDALAEALPQTLTEAFTTSQLQFKMADGSAIEIIELRILSETKGQLTHIMAVEPDATQMPGNMAAESQDSPFPNMDELVTAATNPQPAMAGAPKAASGNVVDPITVRPVEFSSFDQQPNVYGEENKNLDLVMDVTLNLTVELGKTELSIKDVLELTRGSVIELDRVAGEPVDLMANGKLIAKGEVVVIEDNFGLRITSIVSPADRLRGL